MEPECIVLDEPTAMLDPEGRRHVLSLVKALNKEKNITILMVTHHMEEVILADRIIVMDQGKIVMDGKPKEIFSRVDEMKALGLEVPYATELAWELKKEGVNLSDTITTKEELVEELCIKRCKFRNKKRRIYRSDRPYRLWKVNTDPASQWSDPPNIRKDLF